MLLAGAAAALSFADETRESGSQILWKNRQSGVRSWLRIARKTCSFVKKCALENRPQAACCN